MVLHAPGDIRPEERPLPRVGARDVLVAVRAVGVCGSDVHYYEHGRIGTFVVQKPLVLGHEAAGVVVDVGSEVSRGRIGARVAVEPGVPDGECQQCRAGRYNLCPNIAFFGTPPVDGALAQFVSVHERFAHDLPANMTLEEGALIEPVSVALWACRQARFCGGEHVLVTGAGPIGILAMKVAYSLGAAEVTVSDMSPERLAFAAQHGATGVVNVAEQPLVDAKIRAHVLLECSGAQSALADGIRTVEPHGIVVAVGMSPDDERRIPLAYMQQREIALTGTFRYAHTYGDAIRMVTSGRVEVHSLITNRFSLEHTELALQAAQRDPASLKSMIVLGEAKE
jgi:L-iditol 2-dehydrogenase